MKAGVLVRFPYQTGVRYAQHVTPDKGDRFEDVHGTARCASQGGYDPFLPDRTEQEMRPEAPNTSHLGTAPHATPGSSETSHTSPSTFSPGIA